MKFEIIALRAKDVVYNLGQPDPLVDGRMVKSIQYVRDGSYGITKGAKNESNFSIALMNHVSEKDIITKIVPFDKVDDFIIVKVEEDKDKDSEIADNLKKVE